MDSENLLLTDSQADSESPQVPVTARLTLFTPFTPAAVTARTGVRLPVGSVSPPHRQALSSAGEVRLPRPARTCSLVSPPSQNSYGQEDCMGHGHVHEQM